jgi:hypothetical protein
MYVGPGNFSEILLAIALICYVLVRSFYDA